MPKMSQDRVHFTIVNRYLGRHTTRQCLTETLGVSETDILKVDRSGKDMHFICRPSQFARFIILRHTKYGEPNNMAVLNMKLVLPPEPIEVMDCSGNPPGLWTAPTTLTVCSTTTDPR